MKLCLAFHCLCESYDHLPESGRELFVSLKDMTQMVDEMSRRNYKFSNLEDPSPNTVTITFDDGYYNNQIFGELARRSSIPYLVFISTYYTQSGRAFPWMEADSATYASMQDFDYYRHFNADQELSDEPDCQPTPVSGDQRPMSFGELKELLADGLAEIGCHGYYHQPLSEKYQQHLVSERDLGLNALQENLQISPRYYALANGMYTSQVVKQLLDTFDRVMTIDGRPYRRRHRVVHRISLLNPEIAGPLIWQIDKHLNPARQLKRAVRTMRRLGPAYTLREIIGGGPGQVGRGV